MKNDLRGSIDCRYDVTHNVFGILWNDNSFVKILWNLDDYLPMATVKRWSRKEKKEVIIPQINFVANDNKNMGGVDKLDCLIQKYWIKIRGKKWYIPHFTNFIDNAIVNEQVFYNKANSEQNEQNITLLELKRRLALCYINWQSISNPKSAGGPSLTKSGSGIKRVHKEIRTDAIGYFLERSPGESNENVQSAKLICVYCASSISSSIICCAINAVICLWEFKYTWYRLWSPIGVRFLNEKKVSRNVFFFS